MTPAVERWRKDGKYLPDIMRDFHDQKDLFKALHETVNVEGHEYCKEINWRDGQCYVIDIFLWFMARHGYVLRKSTAGLPFDPIETTLSDCKARRDKASAAMLGLTPLGKPDQS